MEAKGGNSSLGSRNGFQQGSKEYFDDLLNTLEGKATNSELIEEILASRGFGEVEYFKVHQKFTTDGNLKLTELQKFEL